MSVTIKLSKPVKAHDEEVSEITLRKPVPKDVMELGSPQLLVPSADGESAGVEIRAKVVGRYICRLASIPMNSVEALEIADFMKAQGVIMNFLASGGSEKTETDSPTDSST